MTASEPQPIKTIRYCIGKASRYQENDIVNAVPFTAQSDDIESQLRANTYDSYELARVACDAAAEFNPVGFVVLMLETPE